MDVAADPSAFNPEPTLSQEELAEKLPRLPFASVPVEDVEEFNPNPKLRKKMTAPKQPRLRYASVPEEDIEDVAAKRPAAFNPQPKSLASTNAAPTGASDSPRVAAGLKPSLNQSQFSLGHPRPKKPPIILRSASEVSQASSNSTQKWQGTNSTFDNLPAKTPLRKSAGVNELRAPKRDSTSSANDLRSTPFAFGRNPSAVATPAGETAKPMSGQNDRSNFFQPQAEAPTNPFPESSATNEPKESGEPFDSLNSRFFALPEKSNLNEASLTKAQKIPDSAIQRIPDSTNAAFVSEKSPTIAEITYVPPRKPSERATSFKAPLEPETLEPGALPVALENASFEPESSKPESFESVKAESFAPDKSGPFAPDKSGPFAPEKSEPFAPVKAKPFEPVKAEPFEVVNSETFEPREPEPQPEPQPSIAKEPPAYPPLPPDLRQIVDQISSDDQKQVMAGIREIRTRWPAERHPQIVSALRKRVISPSVSTRILAIQTLALKDAQESLEFIVYGVDDHSIDVREATHKIIETLNNPRSIPFLVERLNSPQGARVALTLSRLGPEVESHVITFASQATSPSTQLTACSLLGTVGTEKSLNALQTIIAKSKSARVRLQAANAIDRISQRANF